MEDSFIDDRSQLTQRSPLTAMKQKKTDKSVNMIDIYRASLLTPHRQQLRFQSPAFHRHKNRYTDKTKLHEFSGYIYQF